MKFKLPQEKLEEMFEKLHMNGMIDDVTIQMKMKKGNPIIISAQKEPNGRSARYVIFTEDFFTELEHEPGMITVDAAKILKTIKNIQTGTPLSIKTKKEKLSITGKRTSINISYREPEKDEQSVPFVKKKDTIYVGKKKDIPLDINFSLPLDTLKKAKSYASSISSEYFKFIGDEKITIRVGGLHSFDDYVTIDTGEKLPNDIKLSGIYTYGIKEVADTFRSENMSIHMASEAPACFVDMDEKKTYQLYVLIPPQIEK